MIASEFEVVKNADKYRLTFDDNVIQTGDGIDVEHSSESFLRHMIAELDIEGSITLRNQAITAPKFFGAYAIFSIQKRFVERHEDELSLDFGRYLLSDQMLSRVAGPEHLEQVARWSPVYSFLKDYGLTLPNIDRTLSQDPEEERIDHVQRFKNEHALFIDEMRKVYGSLTIERRTVVTFLRNIHDGSVLFPVLLATGRCTPDEYASGVMAAHCLSRCFGVKAKQHRKAFVDLRDDARTAVEYLRHY